MQGDDWLNIRQVCVAIGGTGKPVHPSTYYRGAARGIYPPPEHPAPGITRVRRSKILAAIARQVGEEDEVSR